MKQKFKVRVRLYGTGETIALSEHEMDNENVSHDDFADTYTIGEDEENLTFREFDLVLTATPPEKAKGIEVDVDVPDDADSVSVDVPDPVPA